jgi:hypothetical protein
VKQSDEQLPSRRLNAQAPRWVKVFGVVGIVMILLFVILHGAGLGLGGHMHHLP